MKSSISKNVQNETTKTGQICVETINECVTGVENLVWQSFPGVDENLHVNLKRNMFHQAIEIEDIAY